MSKGMGKGRRGKGSGREGHMQEEGGGARGAQELPFAPAPGSVLLCSVRLYAFVGSGCACEG